MRRCLVCHVQTGTRSALPTSKKHVLLFSPLARAYISLHWYRAAGSELLAERRRLAVNLKESTTTTTKIFQLGLSIERPLPSTGPSLPHTSARGARMCLPCNKKKKKLVCFHGNNNNSSSNIPLDVQMRVFFISDAPVFCGGGGFGIAVHINSSHQEESNLSVLNYLREHAPAAARRRSETVMATANSVSVLRVARALSEARAR